MEKSDLKLLCEKCGKELKTYPEDLPLLKLKDGVQVIGVEICPCLPRKNRPAMVMIGEGDDQES